MERNKVLIIGAGGMLGQELVRAFSARDFCASQGLVSLRLRSAFGGEVFAWDKKEIDITNQGEVDKKIGKLKPQIIINAAAYNAVDKAEDAKEFKIAKKLNGEAPGYLAKIAKKIGATLVHYSTDYVFDGEPVIPEPSGCTHSCGSCSLHKNFRPQIGFDENAKPRPVNNYGKSKLLGEKAVAKNAKKYYLIRTSKIFGKPGSSEGAKKSFFDVMLEASKNNKFVRVVDEENSCFTYAPDLARKTREIIEAQKPFGIYHVVNSDSCTWYEAVLELYKQAKISTKGGSAFGGKFKVIPVSAAELPRPARRPHYSVLLNTKLNPLRSYKEALKEYLKIIK